MHLLFPNEKDNHIEIIRFDDKGITRLQDKSLETIDGFKDKRESVSYDEVREAMNQLHVDRFKRVVVGTMGTTI